MAESWARRPTPILQIELSMAHANPNSRTAEFKVHFRSDADGAGAGKTRTAGQRGGGRVGVAGRHALATTTCHPNVSNSCTYTHADDTHVCIRRRKRRRAVRQRERRLFRSTCHKRADLTGTSHCSHCQDGLCTGSQRREQVAAADAGAHSRVVGGALGAHERALDVLAPAACWLTSARHQACMLQPQSTRGVQAELDGRACRGRVRRAGAERVLVDDGRRSDGRKRILHDMHTAHAMRE